MKTFAIAAAASLLSLAAVPAAAEDFSVNVAYGDLDLSTAAGTQKLAQRLDASAKEVCGRPDVRDVKANAVFAECRDTVVANAREQLDAAGIDLD